MDPRRVRQARREASPQARAGVIDAGYDFPLTRVKININILDIYVRKHVTFSLPHAHAAFHPTHSATIASLNQPKKENERCSFHTSLSSHGELRVQLHVSFQGLSPELFLPPFLESEGVLVERRSRARLCGR